MDLLRANTQGERASEDDAERSSLLPRARDVERNAKEEDEMVCSRARAMSGSFRGRLAIAALAACAACAALAGTMRTERRERAPESAMTPQEATLIEEWGDGELHVMKWTSSDGFAFDANGGASEFERAQRGLGAEAIKWAVKTYYPGRITEGQEPFGVFYTVEDFPQTQCLSAVRRASGACHVGDWAPVYDFSSAPRDESLLPSLVPATLITLLPPILEMLSNPGSAALLTPPAWDQKMFNIAEVPPANRKDFAWNALIPKIVWRGSDYRFLGPQFDDFIEDSCHTPTECKLNHIATSPNRTHAMRLMSERNDITPRFRMVLKSILEPSWLDARFFCVAYYDKRFPMRVRLGNELGVEDDEELTNFDLARFKYQIDLGGAGGTTWTGTIHKLTMPGVLFHHETRMKDSYFDTLVPMVHYIPVKEDLSDLRERFEWAQANPQRCQEISAAASQWVRYFNQRRALLRHNYDKLVVPLHRVIDPNRQFLRAFEDAHPAPPAATRARLSTATASSSQS